MSDSEDEGNCGSCGIELDYYRDGSTEDGFRCNNCYWEEEEGVSNVIYPDYRIVKSYEICNDLLKEMVNEILLQLDSNT
tara:strand:- start:1538 stop:1774 length:237 start_codon:yes stop_codon:yes gene_type:complete